MKIPNQINTQEINNPKSVGGGIGQPPPNEKKIEDVITPYVGGGIKQPPPNQKSQTLSEDIVTLSVGGGIKQPPPNQLSVEVSEQSDATGHDRISIKV